MGKEEMKVCPFCGSHEDYPPEVIQIGRPYHGNEYVVCCSNCSACGANCDSGEEAIELWNTRKETTDED